ncbi:MAG: hypothetical protein ACLQUY_13985 [Ktedonobacterales bacterium]
MLQPETIQQFLLQVALFTQRQMRARAAPSWTPRRSWGNEARTCRSLERFDSLTMDEVEWRKVIRLPDYAARKVTPSAFGPLQQRLFA